MFLSRNEVTTMWIRENEFDEEVWWRKAISVLIAWINKNIELRNVFYERENIINGIGNIAFWIENVGIDGL